MSKTLLFTLAFLSSSWSLAVNYTFKESHFTVAGLFKNIVTLPNPTPAFDFIGRTTLIEDADGQEATRAQVTIRRTTYDCDEVTSNYDDEYSCRLTSTKFMQILDDVATRQGEYTAAVGVLTNFFTRNSYYETVEIPMGSLDQAVESSTDANYEDPTNDNAAVKLQTTTTGLKAI